MSWEAFDIPVGWETRTIAEVAGKPQYGWTTRARRGDGIKLLRTTDITSRELKWDSVPSCEEVPRDISKYELRPGDIVVSRAGSVGISQLIDESCPPGAVFASYLMRIHPDPALVRPRFLHQYMRSPHYWRQVRNASVGVGLANVNGSKLASMTVPIPPVEQQDSLVSLLDGLDLRRASAKNHLSNATRTIQRFRQAVLVAACSGRLTIEWREQSLKRPEVAQLSRRAVSPLIDAPGDWLWKQLQDIADLRGGIQKGAKLKPGEPTREVPYLRVANVQRGWLDLSEIKTILAPDSKIADLKLQPGDILFNEGGDRDKLGRGWIWEGQIQECIHQNHVFRARLRDARMQPRFYSWFGNSIGANYFIDQGKQTVNLASLSMTRLQELPVPVPSLEEQAEIVRRVDTLLQLADNLLARVEMATRLVERSSQAVLAKAFRGELLPAALKEATGAPAVEGTPL